MRVQMGITAKLNAKGRDSCDFNMSFVIFNYNLLTILYSLACLYCYKDLNEAFEY